MNFLLILLAALPLPVMTSVFFPYISGKVLLTRFSVTAVAVLFFLGLINKRSFQDQMGSRIRELIRNPIFFFLSAHIFIFAMSAFFAVNQFWAFFGSIERGEGVVGVVSFFGFFIFSVLLFQYKEWDWFFKVSMGTGIILFIDAVKESMAGVDRPGSFTGQYTYLATYFIFIIFLSFLLYIRKQKKDNRWGVLYLAMIPISFLGILITKTRGALVGLAAGLFLTLIYLASSIFQHQPLDLLVFTSVKHFIYKKAK
jgi:hypothetical protein